MRWTFIRLGHVALVKVPLWVLARARFQTTVCCRGPLGSSEVANRFFGKPRHGVAADQMAGNAVQLANVCRDGVQFDDFQASITSP
jgi:hypothetical protein